MYIIEKIIPNKNHDIEICESKWRIKLLDLTSDRKIKLTIKSDYIFESLFAFYLLIMGLLSGYLGKGVLWFSGLIIFIVLLLINKKKYRKELLGGLFFNPSFYAVFILGCASIVLGSSNQYLAFNLTCWFKVLLVLISIIILGSNSKHDFRSILKSFFYCFNM